MDSFDATLRRLAVRDERFLSTVSASESGNLAASGLDRKSHALARMAALVALDAAPQSYSPCVDAARAAGATREEIVGVLISLVPIVGTPRVVSATPSVGLALGYDLEVALESTAAPRS